MGYVGDEESFGRSERGGGRGSLFTSELWSVFVLSDSLGYKTRQNDLGT